MYSYTLTFVGGGRMASALIAGLIESDVAPSRIQAIDPDQDVLNTLASRWGIATHQQCNESALRSDILVLAVKPQIMPSVLAQIEPFLVQHHQPMVISVASGISLETLNKALGPRPMVRTMPNTPATLGVGMTAMVGNDALEEIHQQWAKDVMGRTGACVWLKEESQLDLVTALSGSGPAYFFALAEGLVQAAMARGMSPDLAKQLVHQTAFGAGVMLSQKDVDARALRQAVTSPGGTTEAALKVFEAHRFTTLVDEAVEAAMRRSQALGQDNAPSPSKEAN